MTDGLSLGRFGDSQYDYSEGQIATKTADPWALLIGHSPMILAILCSGIKKIRLKNT